MINPDRITPDTPVVSWWSGGVTSAVTCKMMVDMYDHVRIIFIDTKNEDPDTYRFMMDCEDWYGIEIETITNEKYDKIQDVWRRFNSLNVGFGAICSSELKRETRKKWEKENEFSYQAFGFDINEPKRALSIHLNYPETNPVFPLLYRALDKEECIEIIEEAGIEIPAMYRRGFHNNNCWQTGCVQGGIGYWQKMKREYPDKFNTMADMEHELTDKKGHPVTMLKDQAEGGGLLFLKPHPDYPEIKDISMKKGREPEALVECNGFCGTNDLEPQKETEINFQTAMQF